MKKFLTATLATFAVIIFFAFSVQAQQTPPVDFDSRISALEKNDAEKAKLLKEVADLKKITASLQGQVTKAQTRADEAWKYADQVDDSVRKTKEVLSLVAENAATSKQQLQSLDEIAAKLYPQKPVKDTAGNIVSEPKTTIVEAVVLQDQKINSKIGLKLFLGVVLTLIIAFGFLNHGARKKANQALSTANTAISLTEDEEEEEGPANNTRFQQQAH